MSCMQYLAIQGMPATVLALQRRITGMQPETVAMYKWVNPAANRQQRTPAQRHDKGSVTGGCTAPSALAWQLQLPRFTSSHRGGCWQQTQLQ